MSIAPPTCAPAPPRAARTGTYPASDRLDIIARAADIAAAVAPDLGRELFVQAVDVATGINDDAAQLLAVHADLASRAPSRHRTGPISPAVSSVPPKPSHRMSPMPASSPTRRSPAAAARLHPATGLAAASRWDDEDRIRLASTLPAALTRRGRQRRDPDLAGTSARPPHRRRPRTARTISSTSWTGMRASGASGHRWRPVSRSVAVRGLAALPRRRPRPAALARRLLDAADFDAASPGTSGQRSTPCAHSARDPTQRRAAPIIGGTATSRSAEVQEMLADPASRGWATLADDVAMLNDAHVYGEADA